MPLPEVGSLDELDALLARATAAEERRRRAGRSETVGERLAAERPLLAPLPARPSLARARYPVRSSGQALVAFGGSRCSVPVRHAGAALRVRAYATTVEVWSATTIIARHPRAVARGTLSTDSWHCLPALMRKPGAFANAIPVRQTAFPAEAQAMPDALEAAHAGDRRRAHREFPAVCAAGADVEPVRWRAACAAALARRETSAAGVRAALAGALPAAAPIGLPEPLAAVHVPAGDVDQHSRLPGAGR